MIHLKHLLFLLLVLPQLAQAQTKVMGVGSFVLGLTTPDSLQPIDFKELEPALIKGTLTLACPHVRCFRATRVTTAGMGLTQVVLSFYENQLVKLSCDYSDSLSNTFTRVHGPRVAMPVSRFLVCTREKDKLLLMYGEDWSSADVVAVAVYWQGYGEACQFERGARLTLWRRMPAALWSACDLPPNDPLLEEYLKAQ